MTSGKFVWKKKNESFYRLSKDTETGNVIQSIRVSIDSTV